MHELWDGVKADLIVYLPYRSLGFYNTKDLRNKCFHSCQRLHEPSHVFFVRSCIYTP